MLATCCHERHVLVISGQHDNSADTDHQISRVVSKFGVVVFTKYVVVLTNHKWPVISSPHPLLMWWNTHAIHIPQTSCSPVWINWSWSCAWRTRWEGSTCKNYFIIWLYKLYAKIGSYVQHNTGPIRPYIVRRNGEDISLKTFYKDI